MSDLFSATLPRRRADRPEHPARALSVPWQQIWPGALSSGRRTAGLPPCSSPRVQRGVLRSLALHLPPTRPSREPQPKQKANRGRIPSLGPAGPSAPVIVSARHQKAAAALNPAEQNFWQIDHFGKCLTCSAPPCLDGAQTDQSTRLELSRCLGNKSGLVRSRQGAELPAYLRVRVPASKGACCALSLSTCPPPGQVENHSRNKRPTVAGSRRWVPRGQAPP
jgi:hypothetical protein